MSEDASKDITQMLKSQNLKNSKPVKQRLLCLHGYRQDGETFRQRIGALRWVAILCCQHFQIHC